MTTKKADKAPGNGDLLSYVDVVSKKNHGNALTLKRFAAVIRENLHEMVEISKSLEGHAGMGEEGLWADETKDRTRQDTLRHSVDRMTKSLIKILATIMSEDAARKVVHDYVQATLSSEQKDVEAS